nr:immunoglobulin heavy chain junction region [Macaca mulatta]MOX59137.1 immunoglobulin heavy chain junction region [Macaca mulatta]MOX59226.1 immunoglobulin heavy chain junction region [Macaca mulatta]MOX59499.1 immunoglobulin heavy chain junction region [Macaca mulatta]MOX59786.1 immunoglobulin heavy chain junction region [Macaca mulatta]
CARRPWSADAFDFW